MTWINPHVQLPGIVTKWFPNAIWRIKSVDKTIFLTFDDGPIQEVTPWVLDLLGKEKIQATFFCVGENVKRNPELFKRIIEEGHSVGNHTFNHLQGLKTDDQQYYKNIAKANELIHSELFRPPHGWLTKKQYKMLLKQYKIVMWDVISRDFDSKIDGNKVVDNVMKFVRSGSVIIFHDSLKAEKNLKYALPKVINLLQNQGYTFNKL